MTATSNHRSPLTNGPHQGQPVARAGVTPKEADAAVILVHGRGASAGSMLEFAREFTADRIVYVAPQAAGHTWYPHSFLAPIEQNEPGLSSGLAVIGHIVEALEQDGIPTEQIILLGFSQGACLAGEFAARNARRYGGVVMLSGGLIGQGGEAPFEYAPTSGQPLDGTPVFLGCSDIDAHIPLERVQASTQVFNALGADVTERIYPGMGHTVNMDEIAFVRTLLGSLQ
ncbi:MAG: alpha/beta fold hydrolase [Rhodothermales bacterium]